MYSQYCDHLEQEGIFVIKEGLNGKRAKKVTDYSWLCHHCGTLWTGFRTESHLEAAVQELSDGQRMFVDWDQSHINVGIFQKTPVVGLQVWMHPEETNTAYMNMMSTLEGAGLFNVANIASYKKKQDGCETRPLYNPAEHNRFTYLLDIMPIRGKIPEMDAEPDWYSANIAFTWYWILDCLRSSHVVSRPILGSLADGTGHIGEMGPRTPKGPFPTSQVMFALAADYFHGTYIPLDYAEWPIMGLLGMHEWFKREQLLEYNFGKIKGTDWTNMSKEFKEIFDVLFASHFIEDFIFGWNFRQRRQGKGNQAGGYDHYPYDEMYTQDQRAKVHWLRLMEDTVTDQAFRQKFMADLQVVINQMYQTINHDGFLATWHYPAYRLLLAGLHEEAAFEMWLYNEAVKLMQREGLNLTHLDDIRKCSNIAMPTEVPFYHDIRILRKP